MKEATGNMSIDKYETGAIEGVINVLKMGPIDDWQRSKIITVLENIGIDLKNIDQLDYPESELDLLKNVLGGHYDKS
jgi:cellobiose-specific phosphotransferase system component IIB